jgi:deazaflavin-dependent oxidoreductase (nitroreductase family)
MQHDLQHLSDEDFCYLTTTGRRSGRDHTIEIWFAVQGSKLYMLAGGREKADWVKNVRQCPSVRLRIGNRLFEGRARLVTDEQENALARKIVYDKYTPRDSNDLTDWARTALPVAVDCPVASSLNP